VHDMSLGTLHKGFLEDKMRCGVFLDCLLLPYAVTGKTMAENLASCPPLSKGQVSDTCHHSTQL